MGNDRIDAPIFASVIVATWNCKPEAEAFRRYIESESWANCEFIFADGDSSDGTPEVFSTLTNVRKKIFVKKDVGIYDAWNNGIELAEGEYICFLGTDDRLNPNFLVTAEANSRPANNKRPALIYGDLVECLDGRSRLVESPDRPGVLVDERPVFDLPHPGCLHHRDLFDEARYDKSYRLAGDLHMILRCRALIARMGWIHLNIRQADVGSNGVSRSPSAYEIYKREFKKIEADLGLSLGLRPLSWHVGAILAKYPSLYKLAKKIVWRVENLDKTGT